MKNILFVLTALFIIFGCGMAFASPVDWEWLDPECQYQFAALSSGLCGVVGTDTWTKLNSETGVTKSGATPCAYLCKPGKESAIPLAIPKYKGTNKGFTGLFRPLFMRNGKWLVAILRHKSDLDMMVAWNVATKKPKILMSWDSCENPEPTKKGTLAYEYVAQCIANDRDDACIFVAKVGAHDLLLPAYGYWIR